MKKLLLAAITAATITFTACKKDETPAPVQSTPKKNYSSLGLKKITITNIPFVTSNGDSWDIANGPDVYLDLTESTTGNGLSLRDNKYDDVTPGMLPIGWTFSNAIKLDTAATYMFTIKDADSPDDDDVIGYSGFEARSLVNNNYPDSINIQLNNTKLTIHFNYQ